MSKKRLQAFTDKQLKNEAKLRRQWLSQENNCNLEGWSKGEVDQSWSGRNIENIVGTIQVPVGVAGPVNFDLHGQKTISYIPLATTEGALVASVNRGCKALSLSKKTSVIVEDVGMTRAPVFQTKNQHQAKEISEYVRDNLDLLQDLIEKSREAHLRLKSVQPFLQGKILFLRFVFDTDQAMGMNMVTIGSQLLADHLVNKFGINLIALSGNLCSDKKSAAVNQILGRGKKVSVEVTLNADTIKDVLKTTPQKIFQVWTQKISLGSALSGANSQNAQVANIVAAIFLATGQDIAHVVEASQAFLSMDLEPTNQLYVSLSFPDMPVGIVGGGTQGQSQQSSLSLLGLSSIPKDGSQKLAAIIGVTALAGELSLLAALSTDSLAQAHQKLGRGK